MIFKFAQKIADAADDMGLEVRIYENYSGRGMYGSTTTGIVGSIGEIMAAAVSVAADMDPEEDSEEIEDFLQEIQDITWDNMARDMIAY